MDRPRSEPECPNGRAGSTPVSSSERLQCGSTGRDMILAPLYYHRGPSAVGSRN